MGSRDPSPISSPIGVGYQLDSDDRVSSETEQGQNVQHTSNLVSSPISSSISSVLDRPSGKFNTIPYINFAAVTSLHASQYQNPPTYITATGGRLDSPVTTDVYTTSIGRLESHGMDTTITAHAYMSRAEKTVTTDSYEIGARNHALNTPVNTNAHVVSAGNCGLNIPVTSDAYVMDARNQDVNLLSTPKVTKNSEYANQSNMNEDIQNLYSTVSSLHQMLMKNPQLLAKQLSASCVTGLGNKPKQPNIVPFKTDSTYGNRKTVNDNLQQQVNLNASKIQNKSSSSASHQEINQKSKTDEFYQNTTMDAPETLFTATPLYSPQKTLISEASVSSYANDDRLMICQASAGSETDATHQIVSPTNVTPTVAASVQSIPVPKHELYTSKNSNYTQMTAFKHNIQVLLSSQMSGGNLESSVLSHKDSLNQLNQVNPPILDESESTLLPSELDLSNHQGNKVGSDLSGAHERELSDTQIRESSDAQLNKMSETEISGMSDTQIREISDTQIREMSDSQIWKIPDARYRNSTAELGTSEQIDTQCICLNSDINAGKKDFYSKIKKQIFTKAEKETKVLKNPDLFYCGVCSRKFGAICKLHEHLKKHNSGGSYHFDHISCTAFLKYETFCSYTQTDLVEDVGNLMTHRTTDEAQSTVDLETMGRKATATRHVTKKQDDKDNVKESAKLLSRSMNQAGRKRKQDHPKPSKPRLYVVPIETRARKGLRERKNGKGKIKKLDQGSKDVIGNFKKKRKTINNTADGLETTEEAKSTQQIADMKIEVRIENVEGEADDNIAISKPFKKRGRPRKTIGEISKVCSPKDVNKVPSSKTKKGKKPVEEPFELEIVYDSVTDGVKSDTDLLDSDSTNSDMQDTNDGKDKSKSQLKARKPRKEKADDFLMCTTCKLPIPKYKYVFHMRSHTGEKPYICDQCGKGFARPRFLTKHMITHQEVKPWQCELCPSQFCQKNEYNMHMRGHAGDRPHQCKVCEMRFLSKTSLHTHQANIHMGLTRFECEVCKRRFFKRSSLNVHKATHYEATLQCSYCDRKFRDKTGLKRHEKIHTGVKKFKCHICDHAFIQSTPFWTHMEKRHFMSRVKVKEMLNSIKESNRRSGIKTEISVLPSDIDHVSLCKTEEEKTKNKKVKHDPNISQETHTTSPKLNHLSLPHQPMIDLTEDQLPRPPKYTDIKVPIVPSGSHHQTDLPSSDGVYTPMETDPNSCLLLRHCLSTPSASVNGSVLTTLPELVPSSPGQTLTVGYQSGLTGSLQFHGYIGINNLQQALDYTSTLPQSATYTDISSDRVVNESQ